MEVYSEQVDLSLLAKRLFFVILICRGQRTIFGIANAIDKIPDIGWAYDFPRCGLSLIAEILKNRGYQAASLSGGMKSWGEFYKRKTIIASLHLSRLFKLCH